MEFDFYDEFKRYSTVELLLITKEAEKYQPEAIAAAEKIILERGVSAANIGDAEDYLLQQADAKSARLRRMNDYKNKIVDALEPMVVPNTTINPAKWFRIFIVFYGLTYGWTLYNVIRTQLYFFRCPNCTGNFLLLEGPLNAIFLTIVFYFLLKNRRWGWILLMASNSANVFIGVLQLPTLFKMFGNYYFKPLPVITLLVVPIVYVVFLWRPAVTVFFGVDVKTKRRTCLAGVAAGLLFYLFLEMTN